MRYRHTQIGWTMIVILGGGSAFLTWAAAKSGAFASAVVLAVTALLLVLLIFFVSLTVTVDDERLELRMGPGPIRRRIPLSDALSVDRMKAAVVGGRLRDPDVTQWQVTALASLGLGRGQPATLGGTPVVDHVG